MAEQRAATKSPVGSPPKSPEAATPGAASPGPDQAPDQAPEATIEANDAPADEGDGYSTASDTSSNATASLSSSVRDFNFENKRRYHKYKEGRYAFPNDDAEQEREDMKHSMVVTLCGGALHSAPLQNPQKILDIGTGTGIWAIDSALVLKPGGWIELQEMKWNFNCDDGTMGPDYALTKMMKLVWEGLGKFGIEADVADTNPQRLKDAGFVHQVHDAVKVPVGEWPKRKDLSKIGAYCKAVLYDGIHAVTIGPLTRGLGWTSDEVEVFLVDVRKDLLNNSIHSYVYYHSLAGQKPKEEKA
ncbi:hypothetical protein COL154_006758 [Colletotrichum chrysophilum]|nr:hypothetical protein COL154_006758 [Colletotrichum chrysophilum]